MGSGVNSSLKSPSRHRANHEVSWSFFRRYQTLRRDLADTDNESNQVDRAIRTGQLNALPHLHTRPINVVVFHGSQGSTRFEVGFPLRCIQRLSRPYLATLHGGWRHNRHTRGTAVS